MKKLLILSMFITSMISISNTKGNIELNEHIKKTTYKNKETEGKANFDTIHFTELKGHFNILNTGLSFGGKTNIIDLEMLKNQKLWSKYLFPEFYGNEIYVKATYTKLPLHNVINLETDYRKEHGELEFGVNSDLKFKIGKYPVPALTLKAFIQKDLGILEDLRFDFEMQHRLNALDSLEAFGSNNNSQNISKMGLQYVTMELSSKYRPEKNTTIYFESNVGFRFDKNDAKYGRDAQLNSGNDVLADGHNHDHGHDHSHVGENHDEHESHADERGFEHIHGYKEPNIDLEAKLDRKNFADLINDYHLIGVKYTGVKGLNILSKFKFYHRFRYNNQVDTWTGQIDPSITKTSNVLTPYVSLKIEYNGVENLKLKNKFESFYQFIDTEHNDNFMIKNDMSIEYDYIPIDQLTITPKLNASFFLDGSSYYNEEAENQGIYKGIIKFYGNGIVLDPSISIEYAITEKLKLHASFHTLINFKGYNPKIYNPTFLEAYDFLYDLGDNVLENLKDGDSLTDAQFERLNKIYRKEMGEDLDPQYIASGIINLMQSLHYSGKLIDDPQYENKILPLTLDKVDIKGEIGLSYSW